MDVLPPNVTRLINEFAKLPTIGPKTAERLSYYLLKSDLHTGLGEALLQLKDGLRRCEQCLTYTDSPLCKICASPTRDKSQIAVVSQSLDIVAIEKTGQYQGTYHVLGGLISPVDGLGPAELSIEPLFERVQRDMPTEIILALNPTVEGETTALYLVKKLSDLPVKVTRLAHGLPIGGDLEYADQMTLGRALSNRQVFS
ncbi:recombination protein RecR [bacterium]|nr:recombination protein RecR [bacterium]